jgi:excisionase family DNA binding protein
VNEFLTTNQAAERLGVSAIRVRQLIAEGRLPAQKFGTAHMIKESDLKLVEDRKVGRPPKAAQGLQSEKQVNKKGSKK